MDTARLWKLALGLVVSAVLAAVAVAVLVPEIVPRSLAIAIAVAVAIAAAAIARLDARARAQRNAVTAALSRAGAAGLEELGDALLAERRHVAAIAALAPAFDEIVDRHRRLDAALGGEDGALIDTRAAASEALAHAGGAGDAIMTLGRGIGDSAAAIEEMVSSIRLVSDNIGGLADTVNSVSSAIGELAASISQVAGNAQEANTLSLQADTKARDGGKAVERLVGSTREIADDIGSVVKKMEELGMASERIGDIVEVIDNIADQTNLLALNAAIEAARAGEHGRGFAVVADEVRKLAENSASSTKEIGKLVKDIQAKTGEVVRSTTASGTKAESGLEMADLAGRAIADILDAVAEASRLIEQISTAAREQAAGSAAIVNSVEQMNVLMREAARSLDEQNTSNHLTIASVTTMQQLTDTARSAVAQQRAACERIEIAARRLAQTGEVSRDASAGIDDIANALKERVTNVACGDVRDPDPAQLKHAENGAVRLNAGR